MLLLNANNLEMNTKLPSILIIDDEGDVCFLLKNALQNTRFEIEHVNTLAQAEIFLKEQRPEIIFLDNHLPDGLGINHVDKLKQLYPAMKVIIITGYDGWADKKKAMAKGADWYLPKPFTRLQVHEALESLVSAEPLNLSTSNGI